MGKDSAGGAPMRQSLPTEHINPLNWLGTISQKGRVLFKRALWISGLQTELHVHKVCNYTCALQKFEEEENTFNMLVRSR